MKKLRMPEGSIVRTRKYQKAYNHYRKHHPAYSCQFCDFANGAEHLRRTFTHFWIVDNLFPYHIWDSSRTVEHMLLVPKRHIISIADYTHEEREEYMAIIAEYESSGYNIYSRSSANKSKTVAHQHTHFIKSGKHISTQVFLNKPHINIVR